MTETQQRTESLYSLAARIRACFDNIDEETGEVPDAVSAELDALAPSIEQKIEALAAVRARLIADIAACQSMATIYEEKATAHQKELARIGKYADDCMRLAGLERVKAPTCHVFYKRSESVNVPDVSKLEERFVRVKPEQREADKKAIADAIKAGEQVAAEIVVKQSLQWR